MRGLRSLGTGMSVYSSQIVTSAGCPLGPDAADEERWLRALAQRLTSDTHLAEDLAQEAWLASLERPPQEAQLHARAWLRTTVLNLSRGARRTRERRLRRERDVAQPERVPSTWVEVERRALQRNLRAALARLEESDRQLIVARYIEGRSTRDLASKLELREGTVRVRLSRAMGRLRALLDVPCSRAGTPRQARLSSLVALVKLPQRLPWPGLAGASTTGGLPLTACAGLAMKNVVAVLAAVLVVWGAWWAWRGSLSGAAPQPGSSAPAQSDSRPALPSKVATDAGSTAPVTDAQRVVVATTEDSLGPTPDGALGPPQAFLARFIDEAGSPLAGVELVPLRGLGTTFARRALKGHVLDRLRASPPALATVSDPAQRSDANGRLRIELRWPRDQRPQRLKLEALAAARTSREIEVDTPQLTRENPVFLGAITLPPGSVCEGRVLASDGRPAPDVEVYAARPWTLANDADRARLRAFGTHPGSGLGDGVRPLTRTDAEGRYRLSGVPVGQLRLFARGAQTLTSYSEPVAVSTDGHTLVPDLILEPQDSSWWIQGQVQDPDAVPVEGVALRLMSLERDSYYAASRTHTDSGGQFRIVAPPGVAFTLEARDARERWPHLFQAPVSAGDPAITLEFQSVNWLDIHARTANGGVPDSLSTWMLNADQSPRSSHHLKVAPGHLRVPVLPEPFYVSVLAHGCRPRLCGPFASGETPTRVDVELAPAPGFHGRVLAAGRPVANAEVHLHRQAEGGRAWFDEGLFTRVEANLKRLPVSHRPLREVRTNEEGEFFLPMTTAGTFCVHAEAQGYARARSAFYLFDPGTTQDPPLPNADSSDVTDIELELTPGGSLGGQVLVAEGVDPMGTLIVASSGDGHLLTTRADEVGAYRFAALTPGPWQVQRLDPKRLETLFYHYTNPMRPDEEEPWTVQVKGREHTVHDIDLRTEAPCILRGTILVNGAAPLGWTASLSSQRVPVDPAGTFVLLAPEPGDYHLSFGPPSVRTNARFRQPITLTPGETPWHLELATGTLELHDLPIPTEPSHLDLEIPPLALTWESPSGLRWQASFRQLTETTARLDQVPTGRLTLRQRPKRLRSYRPDDTWETLASVEVEAGRLATIRMP